MVESWLENSKVITIGSQGRKFRFFMNKILLVQVLSLSVLVFLACGNLHPVVMVSFIEQVKLSLLQTTMRNKLWHVLKVLFVQWLMSNFTLV